MMLYIRMGHSLLEYMAHWRSTNCGQPTPHLLFVRLSPPLGHTITIWAKFWVIFSSHTFPLNKSNKTLLHLFVKLTACPWRGSLWYCLIWTVYQHSLQCIDMAVDYITNGNPGIKLSALDLKRLFLFATAETNFIFQGTYYNQVDGTAMGSP